MDKIKEFFEGWDWLRIGKVALVIVPVVLWEIWYFCIMWIHRGTEWINDRGDDVLNNFLDGHKYGKSTSD